MLKGIARAGADLSAVNRDGETPRDVVTHELAARSAARKGGGLTRRSPALGMASSSRRAKSPRRRWHRNGGGNSHGSSKSKGRQLPEALQRRLGPRTGAGTPGTLASLSGPLPAALATPGSRAAVAASQRPESSLSMASSVAGGGDDDDDEQMEELWEPILLDDAELQRALAAEAAAGERAPPPGLRDPAFAPPDVWCMHGTGPTAVMFVAHGRMPAQRGPGDLTAADAGGAGASAGNREGEPDANDMEAVREHGSDAAATDGKVGDISAKGGSSSHKAEKRRKRVGHGDGDVHPDAQVATSAFHAVPWSSSLDLRDPSRSLLGSYTGHGVGSPVQAIVATSRVVLSASPVFLCAHYIHDNELAWRLRLPPLAKWRRQLALVARGSVVAVSHGDRLMGFRVSDGKPLWESPSLDTGRRKRTHRRVRLNVVAVLRESMVATGSEDGIIRVWQLGQVIA